MKRLFLTLAFALLVRHAFCASESIHWGESVNGISLGVFFAKNDFGRDDAIPAFVIIRNDSDEGLRFLTSPLRVPTDLFAFAASGRARQPIAPQPKGEVTRYFGNTTFVPSKRSIAYELNLRDFLRINPDDLVVTAKFFFLDKTGQHEVLSGNADIHVSRTALPSGSNASPIPAEIQQVLNTRKPRFGEGATTNSILTQAIALTSSIPNATATNSGVPSPGLRGSSTNDFQAVSTSPPSLFPANSISSGGAKLTPAQKLGLGGLSGLLSLAAYVLWRASRRKPQA